MFIPFSEGYHTISRSFCVCCATLSKGAFTEIEKTKKSDQEKILSSAKRVQKGKEGTAGSAGKRLESEGWGGRE